MNPQPSHSTTGFFTSLFLALIIYFMLSGDKTKQAKSFDMLDLGYIYEPRQPVVTCPVSSNYTVTFDVQTRKQKTKKKKVKKQTVNQENKEIEEVVNSVPDMLNQSTPEAKQETNPKNTLARDCYDTLIAIGYKKREAKKLTEEYFKNNSNPDIIQFIKDITFKS